MHSSDSNPQLNVAVSAAERLRQINAFAISLLQQKTLEDLLWSIVENAGSLFGYEDCVIYLVEGDTLRQAASYASSDPDLRDQQREFRLRVGEGVVGRVAQTGKARIVRDTGQEPDYIADVFAGSSELAVPIVFEDRLLGVLDSESRRVDAYDDNDRDLLQFIANVAASRIASALADRERKRAEEQTAALVAELEAKNAELERFTYTVSHDLKTPLITIQGFLGLLEEDVTAGDDERMKQDLERIRAGARQMARLLDDLLALSRVGRVLSTSQDVSLSELAARAVERAAGRISERNVRITIDPELPMVFGDSRRLLTVLQNLIDNAIKFLGDQPEPRIEIGQRRQSSEVLCYVRDNGIGLDARDHEAVFGLFKRLSKEVEGTGIGLALVQRIVVLHGGRIWVESDGEGRGSCFCFTLPSRVHTG